MADAVLHVVLSYLVSYIIRFLFNPYMHKTLPLLSESSLQSYHKPSRMAHVQTRVQHLASVRNN